MKPRIYFKGGLWRCSGRKWLMMPNALMGFPVTRTSEGNDPMEAYLHWVEA